MTPLRKLQAVFILLLVFLVQMSYGTSAFGNETAFTNRKLVMVVMDGVSWKDIMNADVPEIKRLALNGACGLMTTNPAEGALRVPINTYASLGSGARVEGGYLGWAGFNTFEQYEHDTAGDAFTRYMGHKPSKENVVHLGVPVMERANGRLKYPVTLGAIGTALHQHGLKTAVIGNADIPSEQNREGKYRRQVVSIAMDKDGIVDYGIVSAECYKLNRMSIAGVKTDYDFLYENFKEVLGKAHFIVLETGDTSRLHAAAGAADDQVVSGQFKETLSTIDNFIGKLVSRLDFKNDMLMLVVPGPSGREMENGNFLTPIVLAGKGVEQGVIWSGTVKRNGLISNVDISATVMSFFGIKENEMVSGQAVEFRNSDNPLNEILNLNNETQFLYKARYPLVRAYLYTALISILSGLLALIFRKRLTSYLKPLYIGVLALPGVLLWAKIYPHSSLLNMYLTILFITAAVVLAALFLGRKSILGPFSLVTGLTVIMLLLDTYAGSPLGKTSPFSYNAMIGARFYGIGNEYMGVLLGAAIVISGTFIEHLRSYSRIIKVMTVVLFTIITFFIGAPYLGTNAGGAVAAAAGFTTTASMFYGFKPSKKSFLVISSAVVLVLVVLILNDIGRPEGTQSHIGRTVTVVKENGVGEISNIIVRKLLVNIKLIKNTAWSWLYFSGLLIVLVSKRLFPEVTDKFKTTFPWLHKALTGVIAASVFALIFNDSGVVAAAIMLPYAVIPYLFCLLSLFPSKKF